MQTTLEQLLLTGKVLLADGATGTNYFAMGLTSGEPPEFWITDHPDRVESLHQQFVDAGSDIILTNTFGCNRHRLKLHNAQDRTFELAKAAAQIARKVADASPRPVVVAGSVGPTGELFEPLGALTEADAVDAFAEQIEGLKAGGADVAWIETMSAPEEARAAAFAAIRVGMPYVVSKGNCGVPKFVGTTITYSGTPELMATYAELAIDAGVRIVGGCCGNSPEHVASMRKAIDGHTRVSAPSVEQIANQLGPLTNTVPTESDTSTRDARRRRTKSEE